MQVWILAVLSSLLLLITSCAGNEEQKKLGEAQACLDKVPQSPVTTTVSEAIKCKSYISDVDSPQADALRCSIYFLAGGITTNKLVQAVKAINDGQNSEAAFISLLVFNGITHSDVSASASGSTATNNVLLAANHCNASGVKGLQYLGNFAQAGTALVNSYKSAAGDSFWRDPVYNESEMQAGLAACATGTQTCDAESVGTAIIALSDSYCLDKEDDEQCQQIEAALASGATAKEIGNAYYDQLYCSDDAHKSETVCNCDQPANQNDPACLNDN
ncbi:MAG: hypothetical protein KDD58_07335 [Bdellovibrionales bacterium]|nr:hypothetical protein [Bdellovibrionales bacterium]